MPGSILSHFMPLRVNGVLFGVYDYLLPIALYCAWSTLALLDLARAPVEDRGRVARWSIAILVLPVVGALGYLALGRPTLGRTLRLGVAVGGLVVVGAAFGLTLYRIR